ncbi:MAG TPA: hypothetical protein VJO13_18235 [Ktedonobacterales bacterium]|nr:hypothetical protein [Ktedonobacterales bacterium]
MSSVSPDSGATRTGYAITDVYDERRRTFLVQYPIWVVVLLGLAGVLAFALVGFLGYQDGFKNDSAGVYFVFKEGWPLFLWFCALIMALEISILRNPRLRGQLVATLIVTLISMVIVGIIYFYRVNFLQLLQNLLQSINIRVLLENIRGGKFLYAFINFAMIIVFWIDTIRRWIRSSQGKPVNSRVDIGLGGTKTSAGPADNPTLQELISGDLIAGAALVALLALVFRSDVLTAFSSVLGINVPVDNCATVWPFGACTSPGGGLANPPTLTFIDTIQALIYLPLGLLILALSAMLSGFGAVGGVNEQTIGQTDIKPVTDESSTESVSEQVSLTVINTLRSALNRRLRLALDNMLYSLRNAVWPILILIGVIAVASSAKFTRLYLHLQSDMITCPTACKPTLDSFGWPYQYVIYAGLFGILAVVAIVLAVTILVFRIRVAENTFRFLGLIGFILLLTFWIFSLALSGFNGLLKLTGATQREPFPPFGVATIISLAALIIWGAIALIRRMRNRPVVVS